MSGFLAPISTLLTLVALFASSTQAASQDVSAVGLRTQGIRSPYGACHQRDFSCTTPGEHGCTPKDLRRVVLPSPRHPHEIPKLSRQQTNCAIDQDLVPPKSWMVGDYENIADLVRAQQLSLEAGDLRLKYLDENYNDMQEIRDCLLQNEEWPNEVKDDSNRCDAWVKYFEDKVLPATQDARIHLALSFSRGREPVDLDLKKTPAFWPLPEKMDPLNEDERQVVQEVFPDDVLTIRNLANGARTDGGSAPGANHAKRGKDPHLDLAKAMSQFVDRTQETKVIDIVHRVHQKKLFKVLNEYPVVVYLPNANPTRKQAADAIKKLMDNNRRSVAEVKDQMEVVKSGGESAYDAMFDLTAYPQIMEEILKKDPHECGVATGLLERQQVRDFQGNLETTVLIVGASLVTGPETLSALIAGGGEITAGVATASRVGSFAIQVGMDAGVTGQAVYEADKAFKSRTNVALSSPMGGITFASMEDAREAGDAVIQAAFTPVYMYAFGLGQMTFLNGFYKSLSVAKAGGSSGYKLMKSRILLPKE